MRRELVPELSGVIGQRRLSKADQIRYHVAQFWNPQNHPDDEDTRERAIADLSSILGIGMDTLSRYTWAQHNLLWQLHKHDNDEAAKVLARDMTVVRKKPVVYRLLVDTAAYAITRMGNQNDHSDINERDLANALQKIQADTGHEWRDTWHHDLSHLEVRIRPVRILGVTREIQNWNIAK